MRVSLPNLKKQSLRAPYSKNSHSSLALGNDKISMKTDFSTTDKSTNLQTQIISPSLTPPIFIKTDMKYKFYCESIKPLTQPEVLYANHP